MFDLEWWLEAGGGMWRYAQLCAAWSIEAHVATEVADQHQAVRDDAQWHAAGWRGGHTQPAGAVQRVAEAA